MGVTIQLHPDSCLHSIDIIEYLMIPESQHPKPLTLKPGSPLHVICDCNLLVMLSAIQFNNEATLITDEVHDVRPYKLLTPKLMAANPPVAKMPP
jgi:hypothetical protein